MCHGYLVYTALLHRRRGPFSMHYASTSQSSLAPCVCRFLHAYPSPFFRVEKGTWLKNGVVTLASNVQLLQHRRGD